MAASQYRVRKGEPSLGRPVMQFCLVLLALCLTRPSGAHIISSGSDHNCIVTNSPGIICWGSSATGATGLDSTTDTGVLASVGDITFATTHTPTHVTSGDGFSCATFGPNSNIRCWGDNTWGQLGIGSTTTMGTSAGHMAALGFVALPTAYGSSYGYESARNIVAGSYHVCALFTVTTSKVPGNVRCWGHGGDGRLGTEPETGFHIGDNTGAGFLNEMANLKYLEFSSTHPATTLALGWAHSCALFSHGGMRCWGRGEFGQTGTGGTAAVGDAVLRTDNTPRRRRRVLRDNDDLYTGTRVKSLPLLDFGVTHTIIDIAAGANVTCAIFSNFRCRCFGQGTYGQLGQGNANHLGDNANELSTIPHISFQDDISSNGDMVGISIGGKHVCALFRRSKMRCWGTNDYGQLGTDSNVASLGLAPNEISLIPYIGFKDEQQALEVATGFDHTCALFQRSLSEQGMRCWGRGDNGRLGAVSGDIGLATGDVKNLDYLSFDPNIGGVYGQVFPIGGHPAGGYDLTLEIPRFYTARALAIKFIDQDTGVTSQTLATFKNGRELLVEAPFWGLGARKSAVASVLVTADGLNYIDVGIRFIFYREPTMTPFPRGGPIVGGNTVLFNDTTDLVGIQEPYLCQFGTEVRNYTVSAKLVLGTIDQVMCDPSPAVPESLTGLSVSLNAGASFLKYPWIYYNSNITSLVPSEGPVRGGTDLLIQGTDLAATGDPILVKFTDGINHFEASGNAATGGVRVITPDLEPKSNTFLLPHPLSLVLSLNGGQTWQNVPYQFLMLGPTFVRSVAPTHAPRTGGVSVTVKGFNFANSQKHYVRFTNETGYHYDVLASLNAFSEIVVTSPAVYGGGPGFVEISFNSQQWTNDASTFSIFEVHSIFPNGGPTSGGTLVKVSGNGFIATDVALKCRFDTVVVQAIFVSVTQVTCVSPPGLSTVYLEVTVNNLDYTADKREFQYYTNPTFQRLAPDRGPLLTRVPFSVFATGVTILAGNPPVGCRVGSAETLGAIGIVNGSSVVKCEAPPSSGSGAVSIAVNGVDFVDTGLAFTYYSVYAINPTSGPSSGGTEVVISGSGFATHPHAVCAFGDTRVPANVLSSQQIRCVSPQLGASSYNLEVSYDGGVLSQASNKYLFYPTPQITSISPLSVPGSGAMITLGGLNFNAGVSSTVCKFGPQLVSASSTSPGNVLCQAPQRASTAEIVEVSFNKGNHFTNNRLELGIFKVSVMKPGNGPTSEPTDVTMTGTGFLSRFSKTMLCKLGSDPVKHTLIIGRRLDDNQVVCTVPARPDNPGFVDLMLSTNNGTYYDKPGPAFEYYQSPKVSAISPTTGPAWFKSTNGTVWITVTGEAFFNSPSLGCSFGGAFSENVEYIDDKTFKCSLPFGNGKPSVYATFSGQDRIPAGSFAYYSINSVTPNAGPIRGGTEISIAGSGFVDTKELLKCRFGSVTSQATFVTEALVLCTTPPMSGSSAVPVAPSGNSTSRLLLASLASSSKSRLSNVNLIGPTVTLRQTNGTVVTTPSTSTGNSSAPTSGSAASNATTSGIIPPKDYVPPPATPQPKHRVAFTANGLHFTASNNADGDFQFYSVPTISGLSPNRGETAGGLLVTIYGTEFRDTERLSCKFGDEITSLPVPAQYVSSMEIRCNSSVHVIGEVAVLVSLNTQQFHTSPLTFEYESCPPGTFARVHKDPCKPCAPGTYANRRGTNLCKLCPRAEYVEERGASECNACPKNTWMPTNAIRDHISKCTCMPGFYHPKFETGVECLPCPLGASCEGGQNPPRAISGYWESTLKEFTFLECDVPDACAGGPPQACAPGYGGRLCGRCLDGYYQTGKHCEVCPDLAIWILVFFIIFCLMVAALLLKSVGKHATSYGATVGIGTYFFQVLAMLNRLEMNWPPLIRRLISFLTAPFTFDIDILATECSFPVSFRSKWVATMLMPFAFCLLFCFLYWAVKIDYELRKMSIRKTAARKRRRRGNVASQWEEYGLLQPDPDDEEAMDPDAWEAMKMKELTDLPSLRRRLINAFLLLLSLFYLLIVMAALEIFDCTTREDGLSTLDAHPALVCTDAWWYAFLPIGIVGVLGYGVILPVCLFWWLRLNSHRLYTPEFLEAFGSLYSDYKIEYSWWEPMNMAQKMMMVLPLLYLTSFPDFQVVMFLIVLFIGLTISFGAHPFYIERYNRLQTNLRWCACLLLMVGMVYRIGNYPHWSVEWVLLSIGLLVIFVSVVTLLVVVVGDMVVTKVALLRNVARREMESLHILMHPHGKTEIIQWLGAHRSGDNFQQKLCGMLNEVAAQYVVAAEDRLDTTLRDMAPFDRFINLYTGGTFLTPAIPFLRQWLLTRISAVQADPAGSQRELKDVLNFTATFAEFNNYTRLKNKGDLGAGPKGPLKTEDELSAIGDVDAVAEEACTSIVHTMMAGVLTPKSTGKVLRLIMRGDTDCLQYISAALLGLPEMLEARLLDRRSYINRDDSHIDADALTEEQPLIPFLHMLYEDTFTDFAMYTLGNLIEDTELPEDGHDFRRDPRSSMYLLHELFISTRELGGVYEGFEYDDYGYAYYTPKRNAPQRFLGGALSAISTAFGGGKNRDEVWDPTVEEVERDGWASYITAPTDAVFGTRLNVTTRRRRFDQGMVQVSSTVDVDPDNMDLSSDEETRRQRMGVIRLKADSYFLTEEEAREREMLAKYEAEQGQAP